MSVETNLLVSETIAYVRDRYAVKMYDMKVRMLCAQGHLTMVQVPGEPLRITKQSIDRLYAPVAKKAPAIETAA
jgi:hypothetical protein